MYIYVYLQDTLIYRFNKSKDGVELDKTYHCLLTFCSGYKKKLLQKEDKWADW